jgi:FkbM family methyltransferase
MVIPKLIDYKHQLYQEDIKVRVSRNNHEFIVKFDEFNNFWTIFDNGTWEENTFLLFDQFINSNTVYIDIGAWIGPTVLYASRISKKVYAFEPSRAFDVLHANIALNQHNHKASEVTLYKNAVGLEDKFIQLGSTNSGNSMDSLLDKTNVYEVKQINLITFLSNEDVLDEELFIKIDIEGGEYSLLSDLIKHLDGLNFKMLVSTHPRILYKSFRRNSGLIISLIKTLIAQVKILKFHNGYLYHENLSRVRYRLYSALRSLHRYDAFIYSSQKV